MTEQINRKAVGEKLRKLRGRKTREEVSAATGLSVRAIESYETGQRSPSDDAKMKLAKYYHTRYHIFFQT